jgi:hypothetical protein
VIKLANPQWDGSREAPPGEPQRRDAAAHAMAAAHTFPAAARGARPRGATDILGEAPQCAKVVRVAGCLACRRREERQEEQQHPAYCHGFSCGIPRETFSKMQVMLQVLDGKNCLGGVSCLIGLWKHALQVFFFFERISSGLSRGLASGRRRNLSPISNLVFVSTRIRR